MSGFVRGTGFLKGASVLVLAAMAGHAAPLLAQEADEGSGRERLIDVATAEILVTATKKRDVENVQQVPLAVTAFNADTLDALKIRDLESLGMAAPNVSLNQVGTTKGLANFSIRGLGINSSIPSIDPTVGVFVDGVYLGVNNGVVFDTFDLDSIEILRGPQGILFGRNTTGGAVLVNSGNPTDTLQFKLRGSVEAPVGKGRGGWNKTVQQVMSGPLVQDVLNFKLGVYYNDDDGYFRNLANGRNHGASDTRIVRAALEYKASDNLRFLAKAERFSSKGDGPSGQNHGVFARDSFDFAIDNPGFYDARSWLLSLRTDLDVAFGDGVITNIFGYRDYKESSAQDIDSTPLTLFHSINLTTQEQYSNELRYAGSFGPLDLTVGGYWFTQNIAYDEGRNLNVLNFGPPVLPPGVPPLFYGGGRQDHDVLGLFGQADFSVTEDLHLIAGLRWSKEDKAADITYVRPRARCSVVYGTCPVSGFNPSLTPFAVYEPNGFSDSRSWKTLSPKLAVQYHFGDQQAYAGWTRGFRSGGYNFRVTDVAVFLGRIVPAQGGPFFDEERVDSFEAGLKLQTADRKGTLNAALFLTQVGDMQREVNNVGTSGVVQNILNTADAEIFGFEAEGRYALTDRLLVSANVGYLDAKYKNIQFDISGVNGVIDDADYALALPRVPEWTFGVGMVHELDLGKSGTIISRASFQHRDKAAYTDNNFGWLPAFDDLEASISWNLGSEGQFSVALYGKNLLDDVQLGGDTQLPFGAGPLSDGNNVAFDPRPAAGTFSPLSRGRRIGLEFTAGF